MTTVTLLLIYATFSRALLTAITPQYNGKSLRARGQEIYHKSEEFITEEMKYYYPAAHN